jgi:hypothetical protein
MTHAADELQNAVSQKCERDGGCALSHHTAYTIAKKIFWLIVVT